tara:strand:+ start:102 stop:410 length:309 start_codon:yes stop_codon:yes gene_type:complete
MLYEFPKILTLDMARKALAMILDALIHMQYSGRDEGRNSAAKRRNRTKLNAYADEFQAVCNSMARRYPKDADEWLHFRNQMAEEKKSLVVVKEHIMDQDSVW